MRLREKKKEKSFTKLELLHNLGQKKMTRLSLRQRETLCLEREEVIPWQTKKEVAISRDRDVSGEVEVGRGLKKMWTNDKRQQHAVSPLSLS